MEEEKQNNVIAKTFFWMFLGLLGTAIVAWYTYASGLFISIILGDYWSLLLLAEIVVVILFSALFRKLPPTAVGILYFVYSMLNGVTLSTLFVLFELSSIVWLFVVSAALFGLMAFYGYKTQKDLSNWKTILFSILIAGIVLTLINLFMKNTMLDVVLDWIILLVFFGITAYDMNKIKAMQEDESLDQSKIHIYGAMELYLDFINIFLRILSLFGKRRR